MYKFQINSCEKMAINMLKKGYFYLYYVLFKAWSRDKNPMFSNNFQADICLIFLKACISFSLFNYIEIIFDIKFNLSPIAPMGFIVFILSVGSTVYFFNFSNHYKSYMNEFENWPKKRHRIGATFVLFIVLFIVLNLIFSVELLKNIN